MQVVLRNLVQRSTKGTSFGPKPADDLAVTFPKVIPTLDCLHQTGLAKSPARVREKGFFQITFERPLLGSSARENKIIEAPGRASAQKLGRGLRLRD